MQRIVCVAGDSVAMDVQKVDNLEDGVFMTHKTCHPFMHAPLQLRLGANSLRQRGDHIPGATLARRRRSSDSSCTSHANDLDRACGQGWRRDVVATLPEAVRASRSCKGHA